MARAESSWRLLSCWVVRARDGGSDHPLLPLRAKQQSVTPQDLPPGCPRPGNSGEERVGYRQAKRKPASGRRLPGRRLLPPRLEQGRDHSSPVAGDSSAAMSMSGIPQLGGAPLLSPGTGLPWAPPTPVSGSPQLGPEACLVLEGVAGGQRKSLGKDGHGDSGGAQQQPLGWPRTCGCGCAGRGREEPNGRDLSRYGGKQSVFAQRGEWRRCKHAGRARRDSEHPKKGGDVRAPGWRINGM